MSYCRANGQTSDVYVIGTRSGLECCGCPLYQSGYRAKRYSQMLRHLAEHKRRLDKVPQYAIERLEKEQKENNDKYPNAPSGPIHNVRMTRAGRLHVKLVREVRGLSKRVARELFNSFVKVYRRKPETIEISGLADLADAKLDLHFTALEKK